MGSSTAKAQRLANEANKEMTHETNEYNIAIADSANRWNWANLQAQNEWNIQQWERENDYNSPSAQVQRYIEAGINPLWAISGGNPGNAAHLESGQAAPAEVARLAAPHVEPEADPTMLNNIVAASRDIMNSALGWNKLLLDSKDVETRRAAQLSGSALDYASAANKRASTTQIETETKWNLETFSTRVEQESQKLQNMRKQLDLMDAQTEIYKASAANLKASEDLIREKINRIGEDYQLRWKQIDAVMLNARANWKSSEASMQSAGAAVQNAETNAKRLSFDQSFAKAQVSKWNNDQLLDFLRTFSPNLSGELKGGVQVGELGVSGKASASERHLPEVDLFRAAGLRAIQWAADDPANPQAAQAASIAVDKLNQLENDIHVPYAVGQTSSNSSVLNPSSPWQ